jgi:hypothetical protein
MKTTEFYKQHEICAKENCHEVIPKTDILVCKKFNGGCSLIFCLNNHNGTKIGHIL